MSKFNHTAHKEMWNWLAENPAAYKGMWHGWKVNGGKYRPHRHECFACDACEFVCDECPLVWPEDASGEEICWDSGGLFDLWSHSRKYEERTRFALQIANLPVKKGVETE